MISKLNDEDALNMLMTSEFEENYSPMEYKEMLVRYRYFYRILFSRLERMRDDNEFEMNQLRETLEMSEARVLGYEVLCVEKEEKINQLKNRRLTWKERLTGKIITDYEDKGI